MKKEIAIAFLGLAQLAIGAEGGGASGSVRANVLSIDVSNVRPVQLVAPTHQALATYAESNSYYFKVNLKEGMKVLYSASYGIGGEAAQAAGVVVERDGHFFFKQTDMPGSNLLLPPGFSGSWTSGESLWDLGEYMDLINRVAFSQKNQSFESSNDVYDAPAAAMVDFRGGTAGSSVFYQDSLQVGYHKAWNRGSTTDWTVYYAKSIGPVALEFRETTDNPCTFKFYMGE